MNKKILLAISSGMLVVLLVLGFTVPLATYIATRGCTTETPLPKKRLHLILGESIDSVKRDDPSPPIGAGCSQNAEYILYLL